jgi:hypothetical protein
MLEQNNEENTIDEECKSPEKKSYRDTEICFKSPLNFQQLGSSASQYSNGSEDIDKSMCMGDSMRMISPPLQQKNFVESEFDSETLRATN